MLEPPARLRAGRTREVHHVVVVVLVRGVRDDFENENANENENENENDRRPSSRGCRTRSCGVERGWRAGGGRHKPGR